jgi:hypothetical protein
MRDYAFWLRFMTPTLVLLLLVASLVGCPLSGGESEGEGEGEGEGVDEGEGGGEADYGYFRVDGVSYPLGFGLALVIPTSVGNQSIVELFTGSDSSKAGMGDMAGIALFHAEAEAPAGTYSLTDVVQGTQNGTFNCNLVMEGGGNVICMSGSLTFEHVGSTYSISLSGTGVDPGDSSTHAIELEWSGPVQEP